MLVLDQDQREALEIRARAGEATAFASLIHSFDRDVRGVVWSVLRSDDATDGVVRAGCERAFRSVHTLGDDQRFKTWLLATCYRSAIDHVGDDDQEVGDDIDGPAAGTFSSLIGPVEPTDQASTGSDVDARLAVLDPGQRAAVMLAAGLGYSVESTAEIVALDSEAVRAVSTDEADLGPDLRARIPAPAAGYSDELDARLRDIEEARSSGWFSGRNLLAAAALIAIVALVALLVSNRSSDSDAGDQDVATQPEVNADTDTDTDTDADTDTDTPDPEQSPAAEDGAGEDGDTDVTPPATSEPVLVNIDGPVTILADEEPVVWRFVSGPVNYRADPGLSTTIIGQWGGTEMGIVGTGGRAVGDGYEWVELAAGEERQSGWVALDFIEPDPIFGGTRCYELGDTVVVLEFNANGETFVGGIRTPGDPTVDYFGVSGRRLEGTRFEVNSQDAQSAVIEEQEWESARDTMATDLGLLAVTDCAGAGAAVSEIDANVTSYPPLPA